jgi:hypothetical protein
MQLKNIKHTAIFLVTVIAIFIIGYTFFLRSFIKNTTYYKPVSVEITGLSNNQFRAVNCHGISPKGRIIKLNKDERNCTFYSTGYIHLNDIVFFCDDSIFQKISAINFNYEDKSSPYIIDFRNIIKTNDNLPFVSLKEHVNPNYSDTQVFFAMFMWSGWYRILYIFIVLVFIIFLVIRYRRFVLSLLKKIAQLLISKFSRLDIEKKYTRLLFSLILCLILYIIFFNNTDFTGISLEIKESSTQTIAVNFAHGHGFPKSGFIEDFEDYNITRYHPTGDLSYSYLNEYKGAYIYHYPPIYELFIGSFYYLFGVNPLLLKQIQLLILIITISFLPILGFKLANKLGFWSGLISAPIVLYKYAALANHLEPHVLIILFLFALAYLFQKLILEGKHYKLIIIGLILSFIILTQLTLILLPVFTILYLFFKLIIKPTRKAFFSFLILLASFIIPVSIWSLYASNHLNVNLIHENSFAKVHNTLLNRNFNNKDVSILEGLEGYCNIKSSECIINDGGWVGPLSVYENDLVDNIVAISLLYNEKIILTTKSAPELLFMAHNEYCENGNPNTEWTRHSDSYYKNDNQSLSPYIRVFLFYINHPKQLFTGSINKIYNGFSSFIFFIIAIWIYIINMLFHFLDPLFRKKNPKVLKYFKILISIILLATVFTVIKINFILFYFTLIALFIIIFIKLFNGNIKQIITPEIFIITLLSLLFFVISTFGLERYVIILDFIFVYQAIFSLAYFSFNKDNYLPTSNTFFI